MAGNSIVRTRPQNHAWDHCGETSAYKTTQWPLLHPCLNEWDDLMWSLRLCNSLGEASPYKVTWLHRLSKMKYIRCKLIIHTNHLFEWNLYIYIYIYIYVCVCIYIYISTHTTSVTKTPFNTKIAARKCDKEGNYWEWRLGCQMLIWYVLHCATPFNVTDHVLFANT